ncbi:MAG TPA: SurA N-terminal domain-containing protein [Kofleriaceae bacterium]|nr:SurA N-terminal domain-containing protein [Kofleriaceae bacterium]
MLENMRKQGASLFIWLIFGILIAVFVINFGPQSPGAKQGCSGGGKRTFLTVGGSTVDDVGFRWAMNLVPGENDSQRAAVAFESLIMRELLAQEAERRGLRIPDGYVDHVIAEGKLHFQGALLQEGDTVLDFRRAFYNEDQIFDYVQFKRWVQNRGMSVGTYKKQQGREILASTMAQILMNSVPASREEAMQSYVAKNTTVSFEAVRFDPRRYGDNLLVSDADLDAWAGAHEAEVKATFAADAWKGKKQIHIRRISLPKAADAADPVPPPTPAPGAPGAPATPPAEKADPSRTKLEGLKAAIEGGRTQFVAAAKTNERDPQRAARGGEMGWHDEGAPNLNDPLLDEAAKKLEKGKVSDIIETEEAFTILTIDDRREGDLTYDQVKRELAEPLAREAWGKEAAKRAAIAALAAVKGKNLKDVFPAEKTGAIDKDFVDVPVQSGSGSAAGSAPVPPPAAPSPAAAPPATAPPVPAAKLEASNETLPTMGPLEPPTLETFGPIARAANRTPIGESPELARALFEELTTGALGTKIYEVKPSVVAPAVYVLVQVTAKQLADVTTFEKDAEQYTATLARERGARYLVDWLRTRCVSMAEKKEITPLWAAVQGYDDQGNKLPIAYAPCMSFNVQ